jgi:hypothetical protein
MSWVRATVAGLAVAVLAVMAQPLVSASADPIPAFIPPDAGWLTTVNYYRAMSGQGPVTENATWSAGAYNHSCYMLQNGITHYEDASKPGYTASGDAAGKASNVAVSSAYGTSARSHIELWMTGPFHAIGVLRYNLQSVGFGKCDSNSTPTWHSGASLNVINGLNYSIPRPTTPIVFPGNATTTNLNKFVTESPNPLTFCGWTGSAGLPVIAMMPEQITSATATITGPAGALEVCTLSGANTTGDAKTLLAGDNALTVIPRAALSNGAYTVKVTTQARTVTWTFTVDSTAATGIMPVPVAAPASSASAYDSVTPFRFGDSRTGLRMTKLLAGTPKRIRVAGQAGLPSDTTAVAANFTVTEPTGNGYLTVYNCTTPAPVASTLNYTSWEAAASAGVFPLSSTGDLCVVSPKETNLVIDVTGYFRPTGSMRYQPITAVPLLDTTTQLRVGGRLSATQTVDLDVPGAGIGVPSDATAVAVNITGINPAQAGFLTAYPCGISRPIVASVNPNVGGIKQNFGIVPLSATGDLCLYSHQAMDVRIDVLGYFTGGAPTMIVPSTPTRVTDTRDIYRTQMNLGTGGAALIANQTTTLVLAGQRGIPANAKALSVNVTAVAPSGNGSLTVWGCGTQPAVKSINFTTGKTVANGMQVQLSATGALCVSSTAGTHLVIDVTGWWS